VAFAKVENELPEKIERLVRCEASAYQKLLMKHVKEKLGSLGHAKGRSIQNTVMELRNICNHPYLSQLHSEEVSFQGNAFLVDSVHCQQRKRQMGSLYVRVNESWWECCRQKKFSQLITCPSWSVSVESLKCLIGYCPS
jgi:SNF2 family DNA or RNA helicase